MDFVPGMGLRFDVGRVHPEIYMEYLQLSMKSIHTPTDVHEEVAKLNVKAAAKKRAARRRGESMKNWPNVGDLMFRMVHDATELKEQGIEKFKAKEYKLAQDKYEEALKILGGWQNGDIRTFRPKPKYEDEKDLTCALWSNLSVVFLKQNSMENAANAARNAITADITRANALFASADYVAALNACDNALKHVDKSWHKVIVAEQKRIRDEMEKLEKRLLLLEENRMD